jgi:hypothetical protein
MSWTGPEQAKFFPPRLSADLPQLKSPIDILKEHHLSQALLVRVSPSFDGAVLQVTQSKDSPRRYFSMKTGQELEQRDKEHAIWLARYYTGLKDASLSHVTLQTAFDDDYPWVNRLLPVWRIEFDSPDKRRAFIYTELNTLAAQHNGNRHTLQAIFQALHSWTWLERFESAQIILMSGFMIALVGMSVTGIAMILSFKRRQIPDGQRRWHRRIAYIVWLPIFLFSASGFYHLLQYRLGENTRGMREGSVMDLSSALNAPSNLWFQAAGSGAANALSFIKGSDGLLIRVERPAPEAMPEVAPSGGGEHAHHAPVTRDQRFAGKANRGEVVYYDAVTGAPRHNYDVTMARHLAITLGGANADDIMSIEQIARFGPDYDFRNKRLPVWKVSLNDDKGRVLFIDSGANLLVDQATRWERLEGLSFSLLHKWNFLRPFGSTVQDGVIVTSILLASFSTVFGFMMLWKQRQRRRLKPAPHYAHPTAAE